MFTHAKQGKKASSEAVARRTEHGSPWSRSLDQIPQRRWTPTFRDWKANPVPTQGLLGRDVQAFRPSRAGEAAPRQGLQDPKERQADDLGTTIGRDLSGISVNAGPLDDRVRTVAERRLGVSLSGVSLSADEGAHRRVARESALAVTEGAHVSFASGLLPANTSSSRFLVGHELAHTAQQRLAGTTSVQCYVLFPPAVQDADDSLGWKHPSGKPLRVSDDGQVACEDNGWGPGTNKLAWAKPSLVAKSNSILASQGSTVRLTTETSSISGRAPQGDAPSTLQQVKPSGGDSFSLPSDCGSACRVVMGSHGEDVAVLKNADTGTTRYTQPQPYVGGWSHAGGNPTAPQRYMLEVLRTEFGTSLTTPELYARYEALSPDEKVAFDKKYGINAYAVPKAGQGLTISTEPDMPGFSVHPGAESSTWNFHYAAVVLNSGGDYVTLESAAGWGPADWIFFLYGTAAGQTFHEEQGSTETHGTRHTTFVVQPESRAADGTGRRNLLMLDVGTSLNGPSALVLAPSYRLRLGSWLENRLGLELGVGGRFAVPTGAASGATPGIAGEATLGLSYGFGPEGRGPFISAAGGAALGTVVNEGEVRAAGTLRAGAGYDLGRGRVAIYLDVLARDVDRNPWLANLLFGAGFSF